MTGKTVFQDDQDRIDLRNGIQHVTGWICRTNCLMDNHQHLLIKTSGGECSPGMYGIAPEGIYDHGNI